MIPQRNLFRRIIRVQIFVLMLMAGNGLVHANSLPEQTLNRFNAAMAIGDELTMKGCMDDAVFVLESGVIETSLKAYAAGHLSADIEFVSGLERTVLERHVRSLGTFAVISSKYHAAGEYQGANIDIDIIETVVVEQMDGQWKIIHIHWS